MTEFNYERTVKRVIVFEEHQDVSVEAVERAEAERKLKRGEGEVLSSFEGDLISDRPTEVISISPKE